VIDKSKKEDLLYKQSTNTKNISENNNNKKIEYLESNPNSNTYAPSSNQNLSTRISTQPAYTAALQDISNINSYISPINFKVKNILANSSNVQSNLRKETNPSNGNYNPIAFSGNKALLKNDIENKKLRFYPKLNIDISNSDKYDLINILTDENINNFTSNQNKENSIGLNNESDNITHLSDKLNFLSNDNNEKDNKNSNLFLTKLEENKINNKNIRNQNNKGDEMILPSLNNLSNKNISNNLEFKSSLGREKLIHDFSLLNNINNKDQMNSAFANSNLLNLISPKNISTKSQSINGKSINYNLSEIKDKNANYSAILNYMRNSPNNANNLLHKNVSKVNQNTKEEDYDEEELKNSKKKSKTNKSYYDILDIISKDYNLTEDNSNIKNNKMSSKTPKYNSNYNFNNMDLKNINILRNNSDNHIDSLISSEDVFSTKNYKKNNYEKLYLNERESLGNFLFKNNIDRLSSAKIRISNSPKGYKNLKSKEFIDNFLNKCNKQENIIEHNIKKINSELKKSPYTIDNTKVDFVKNRVISDINREIDKSIFRMDNKEIKKDKILILLSSEGKDGKKQFFIEDRNSPLFVGELITKVNDDFAFKCKKLFMDKFVEPEDPKKKGMHRYRNFKEYIKNQERLDIKHKEISKVLYDMEACKNISMKRIENNLNLKNIEQDRDGDNEDY